VALRFIYNLRAEFFIEKPQLGLPQAAQIAGSAYTPAMVRVEMQQMSKVRNGSKRFALWLLSKQSLLFQFSILLNASQLSTIHFVTPKFAIVL
jgi:bacteriorhodopsin